MYQTILHATDLSENHFHLCKKSLELAKYFKAKLHFLHVIETPRSLQWAQGLGFANLVAPVTVNADLVMSTLSEALNLPKKYFHVSIGCAHTDIIKNIISLNCGLVIIGSHHPSSVPLITGSTAHTIINHATCDVLTLRAD